MELGTAGFEQERPTDVPAFHDTVKDGWRDNTTKNFKWEDKEELMDGFTACGKSPIRETRLHSSRPLTQVEAPPRRRVRRKSLHHQSSIFFICEDESSSVLSACWKNINHICKKTPKTS